MEPTTPATPNDATPMQPQEDKTGVDQEPLSKMQKLQDKHHAWELEFLRAKLIEYCEDAGIDECIPPLREMTVDEFEKYIQENPDEVNFIYGGYDEEYLQSVAKEYDEKRKPVAEKIVETLKKEAGGWGDLDALIPSSEKVRETLKGLYPLCDFTDPKIIMTLCRYFHALNDYVFELDSYLQCQEKEYEQDTLPVMMYRNVVCNFIDLELQLEERMKVHSVCHQVHEINFIKDLIPQIKESEEIRKKLETQLTEKEWQLKMTLAMAYSQQETIASLTKTNASLQKQADETLPQIQQTMTDEFKKARNAGQRAKDEILIEIAARVKGRSGAGNGVRGMTVKNFVANFRELFKDENLLKWYHVNTMPFGDFEGSTTHDPIENNLRKILDTEKDGKDDKKKKYTPYQYKDKIKPFYWAIYDLTEALATHCIDRGYTFENMAREECHGIGELIKMVFDKAETSKKSVDLCNGDYFPKTSLVQDEADDGDDEE